MADEAQSVEHNKNAGADHRDALTTLLHSIESIEKLRSVRDVEHANEIVAQILLHLPGPITPEQLCRIDTNAMVDWKQIAQNEYTQILIELTRLFDSNWPVSKQNSTWTIDQNVLNVFAIDHSFDFVHVSLSHIYAKTNVMKFDTLIKIFESCIQNDKWLVAAFIDVCFVEHSTPETHHENDDDEQFIQLLLTTPNRIANHFEGKHSTIFDPEPFSNVLLLAVIQAISFIATTNQMEKRKLFEAKFLGQLLGRIAVDFHCNRTSTVLEIAFQVLSSTIAESVAFKTILQEMVLYFPRNSLNICAWYILKTDNPIDFLGDAIQLSKDWEFMLKTKLPLQPNSMSDRSMKYLVKYLSVKMPMDECHHVLLDVMKAWSSKASISTLSIEQHIWLTKFIVLAIELFEVQRMSMQSEKLRLIVHNGIQNHMEELSHTIRAVGMITAEIVLNKLSASESKESKLEFQYDSFSLEVNRVVEEIKQFHATVKEDPVKFVSDLDAAIDQLHDVFNENQPKFQFKTIPGNIVQNASIEIGSLASTGKNANIVIAGTSNSEPDQLDSDDDDDDLQAYDMSNDKPLVEEKRPRYLDDLRETLLETDDPDVFEQCMISCADLVNEKLPNDITKIGIELLQLLIDLEKRFYMENFEMHRNSACIAICCIEPKACAEFLCKEIHAEVGQRTIARKVLMLEILSETAKTLSRVDTKPNKPICESIRKVTKPMNKLIDESDDHEKRLKQAKQIISERIAQKTRRFAHPTADIFKNAKCNRFADVAGDFLFPLLHGFGKEQLAVYGAKSTLKYDTDHILLMTFLNTVATITFASQNCPIITRIAPEVFQLALVLRFHAEPMIRFAVLQMIAAVLFATPKSVLQMHFLNYVQEIQSWLNDCLSFNIIKSEKSAECFEMAKHVSALCIDILTT